MTSRKRLSYLKGLILFVVALGLLMIYSIYYKTATLIERQFERQHLLLTIHKAHNIEDYFTGLANDLASVSSTGPFVRDPTTHIVKCITNFIGRHPGSLSRVAIVGVDGSVVAIIDGPELTSRSSPNQGQFDAPGPTFIDDPLFISASRSLEPVWGTLQTDPWDTRTIPLAVPIVANPVPGSDLERSFDGLYMAYISANYLIKKFILSKEMEDNYYSWIIDKDSRILIHTTLPDLLDQDSLTESAQTGYEDLYEMINKMLQGESGTGRYFYRNEKKYMAYVPITFGETRWSMALSLPLSEIISPIRTGYWHNLLFFGITLVIFSFLATVAFRMAQHSEGSRKNLEHLYRLRSIFATSITTDEMINNILDSVVELDYVEAAVLFFYDESACSLKEVGSRNISEEYLEILGRIPDEKKAEFRSLNEKRSILVEKAGGQWWHKKRGSSWLSVPIIMGDKPIGVMSLGTNRTGCFTEDYINFIETLAEDLGVVINNISLFSLLKEKTILLERANLVKSEFLAMVSHELRTPLSVVIGFLSLLCEGRFEGRHDEMVEFSRVASQRARDLEKLISTLLELSLIEEGKLEVSLKPVDPKKIVQNIHRLSTVQADKQKIQLEIDIPRKISQCMGDPDKIRQILDNLVNNAIKFTPSGGTVTLGVNAWDSNILFFVSDTGPGIEEHKLEKIFDRFFQIDSSMTRNHGGIGLGLAISRELANLQGGKLWAENNKNKGAVFYFTLPAIRPSIGGEKTVWPSGKQRPASEQKN